MRLSVAERLDAYSMPEPNSGCQLWTGDTNASGYGRFRDDDRRIVLAHRESWIHHRGPIPPKLFVCHKCDVPACINPDHLFLGTAQDNHADMVGKKRNKVNFVRGEANRLAKLTTADVLRIRQSAKGATATAADFGVSQGTISDIRRRRRWRHV